MDGQHGHSYITITSTVKQEESLLTLSRCEYGNETPGNNKLYSGVGYFSAISKTQSINQSYG